jgi:MarR family transcriptional regulator, transcriptional regulator for hemolysin
MISEPARLEIALVRTTRSVRRAYDVLLRPIQLNMTEASLLSFVRDLGPLTQRELADQLHIGRASVGSFIDGLEKRGLVCRMADESDRRVWRIGLAGEAREVVDAFDAIDARLRAALRAGLTRAERQQLAELLLRVEQNADAAIGEALTDQQV